MKNTVIFDLDGTLLNTLDDLMDSTNYALSENGLPAREYDEIRRFVGNGIRKLVERAVPQNTPVEVTDRCFAAFCAHYKKNMANKTAPYAGIMQMLKVLSENGFKMAIVTNKADFAARELCSALFGEYVKTVVGSVEGRPNKPAPDGVWYALEVLGASREEAVFVGDSEVDIATAKNAGLDSIGVLWGFRTEKDLIAAGAGSMVSTAEALTQALLAAKK